jgi:hypothetical protein
MDFRSNDADRTASSGIEPASRRIDAEAVALFPVDATHVWLQEPRRTS